MENEIRLDGIQSINAILLGELKEIIYSENAPYIKFILLMTSIEFIGASFDAFPYTESNHSEDRFNDALKKLFPKKYIKYANKNSAFYFYQYLRCGLVHQLRPLKAEFRLTTRKEAEIDGNSHLQEKNGEIYLVLEDFYDDLEKAVKKLIEMHEKGKTPSGKLKNDFIQINKSNSGTTYN